MKLSSTISYQQARPTLEYLQRVGQVIGKYSLEQPYYLGWGNIVLLMTPRGFMTRQYYRPEGRFTFEIDVYDNLVRIGNEKGTATVELFDGDTEAGFYERFVAATATLGIAPPISSHEIELAVSKPFAADTTSQHYDAAIAQAIVDMYSLASAGLEAWQSNYLGYRTDVGVMWGGFDLAAARYNGKPLTPQTSEAMFYQNCSVGEYLMVGFWLGSDTVPPGLYAYITPQPNQIARVDFARVGVEWSASEGLALLSWDTVAAANDPIRTMVEFGDAVYQAAIDLSGWPPDATIERVVGLEASKRLITLPSAHHDMKGA